MNSNQIPVDFPKIRKSPKLAGPPSLPRALALSETERASYKTILILLGWIATNMITLKRIKVNHAFDLFSRLGLHFPDSYTGSKMTIQRSDTKSVGNGKKYTRWTRLYQCLCRTNNDQGRHASKKRQDDVKCSMYARVITTQDDGDLLAFNEISGILDHNAACIEQIQTSRGPIIPLHPELRAHALSLLRAHTPVGRVRSLCRDWARERWGTAPGNATHRYILKEYESTSSVGHCGGRLKSSPNRRQSEFPTPRIKACRPRAPPYLFRPARLSNTTRKRNAEVVAYQRVLEAEDRLVVCLRDLIAVSRNADLKAILSALVDRLRPQLISRATNPDPGASE
ncbi:hypothetical protein BD779DRAFT_1537830 [Infundibulicybe gibba]|nr:hypothetical protein BD779DRAFT_1537830 [Infundibulicybe gibba]